MAVTRDAVTSASPRVNQDTASHTVASQNDRYLLVTNIQEGWTDGITAITYAGASLTKVAAVSRAHGGKHIFLTVWELIAPATGTNSVQWTFISTFTRPSNIHSYYNVDQNLAFDNTGSDTDQNHSVSMTLTAQAAGLITASQGCFCDGFTPTGDSTEWIQHTKHSVNYNEDFDGGAKTMSGTGSDCGERPHVCHGLTLQPPQNVTVDLTGSEAIVATSASVGTIIEGNDTTIIGRTASVAATASIGAAVVDEPIRGDMFIVAGD